MTRQYLNPEGLSPPPGGIYTHVIRAGHLIFVSGQLARDGQGNLLGKGDAAAQYHQAWANVCAAVASVGGGPRDIVKTTTYVVGEGQIPAIRQARQALGLVTPPTSTMIVTAALAVPEALVEIEAIAVLPETG